MENEQAGYPAGTAAMGATGIAYQQQQQQQQQLVAAQQQQLQMFWTYQRQEVEHANDFKSHQLPLARIKKIMKADEDVRMISAEAPILFEKACELFILELTIRSWLHAEENKRRTLQKNDIAAAITRTDIFDFLVDIVPREEAKDESVGLVAAAGVGAAAAGLPYYYPPATAGPGMIVGQPAMMAGIDPGLYVSRGPAHGWPQVWQQGLPDDGGYGSGGQEIETPALGYVAAPPPPPPAAT